MSDETVRDRKTVRAWGQGLGVPLDPDVAAVAHVEDGSVVQVEASDHLIVIRVMCTRKRRMTLEERLARFDPAKHGGEAMAWSPVGREAP